MFILSRLCDVFRARGPLSAASSGLNGVICFVLINQVFFLGSDCQAANWFLIASHVEKEKTLDSLGSSTRQQSVAKWRNVSTLSPLIMMMDRREVEEEKEGGGGGEGGGSRGLKLSSTEEQFQLRAVRKLVR